MSTTSSWTANESGSWRDAFGGWRTDNNYAYQGQWSGYGRHKGLWFFNDSNIRSTLSGRTILSARLRLTRRSSGGTSGAQTPTIRRHNYSTLSNAQNAGEPGFLSGTVTSQSWGWGDTKWVTIPVSWANSLRDGNARGFGIHINADNPYMIFNGSGSAVLEITHESSLSPPATPNTPTIQSVGQTDFFLTTNTPTGTETWEWNPQDAGSNFAIRTVPEYHRGGMVPGDTYFVRVRARNAAGVSSYSAYRTILLVPPIPAGLSVSPPAGTAGETSLNVSWNAANGAANYSLQRENGPTTTVSGTSTTVTGLNPNTPYRFRVRAQNSSGNSAYTGWVTGTTRLPLPEVPPNFALLGFSETEVQLGWGSATWASTYEVDLNGFVERTGITGTTTLFTGLDDGETYTWRVRSRNATGTSDWSAPQEVSLPSIYDPPPTPSAVGPSGTIGPGAVSLTADLEPMSQVNIDGSLTQRAWWQLSNDPAFPANENRLTLDGGEWVADGPVSSAATALAITLGNGPGVYYVRARAMHSEGDVSDWTSAQAFTYSRVKVWDGTEWVLRPVLVWDGSDWEPAHLQARQAGVWR